ncbi:MAG TPA: hypothetical protein VGO04_29005 [Ensifer sp.]|uniref:hypothetical protein n=1 Tax=Ensifer sp. TaxID=1872086 RepID=UPI002E12021F|nr:hypothetical protein [Ensifer sp.]
MSAFGNILGIRATLLLGKEAVVLPAPLEAMEAIEEIEVRQAMKKDSGFKITLLAGREGPLGAFGPPFVNNPLFQRGARVVVVVWNGVLPTPIFDGMVTKTQYIPGEGSNEGKYLMLGRDLTFVMDREQKRTQHPAQDETIIMNAMALQYATYGVIPVIMPPQVIDPPIPVDRTPQQTCSDLAYAKKMAKRHGYQVFIDPGPVPGISQLYFGPVPRPGMPQKPISVNLGPMSDAYDVTVNHDGETLTAARAKVHDRSTGQVVSLEIPTSTNTPLSALSEALTQMGNTKTKEIETSGLNTAQVLARLMAEVNEPAERVLEVSGTIDNTRYNAVLKPYYAVDVRGLGMIYNGTYTVSEVRHVLKPGSYTQTFALQRDGLYPILPAVAPEVSPI